jgi:predicted O-methyltransferase YrrM
MPTPAYLLDNLRKVPWWLRSFGHVRFYMNRALWETGYPWTKLRPEPIDEIFPGIEGSEESVQVLYPFARTRGTSIELDELVALLLITRFTRARRILEVGTYDGNTALNLAINGGEDARVVTIDLPPHFVRDVPSDLPQLEGAYGRPAPFERRQYIGHRVASRIEQVYGDSTMLDWKELGADFDLALIDGNHNSAYVQSDVRNTLSVLKPGGIVLWHDYDLRSVATVLDAAIRQGEAIRWIRGTRFAVCVFDDPIKSARHFVERRFR